MPSNNKIYQKKYRQEYNKTVRNITVSVPVLQHDEFSKFAKAHGFSLSALLRECTDLQIRSAKLRGRAVEEELKELKFLLSNIANNVNQMARHSNRVRQVADEDGLFLMLQEAEKTIENFVEARLKNSS